MFTERWALVDQENIIFFLFQCVPENIVRHAGVDIFNESNWTFWKWNIFLKKKVDKFKSIELIVIN